MTRAACAPSCFARRERRLTRRKPPSGLHGRTPSGSRPAPASHRLVQPNTINLDGIFGAAQRRDGCRPCAVKSTSGGHSACACASRRPPRHCAGADVLPMVNHVPPSGAPRIADGTRVAWAPDFPRARPSCTPGFVNPQRQAATGAAFDGRGSVCPLQRRHRRRLDVGGAPPRWHLLGGAGSACLGERCLLGANSGLGISAGDDCVVEAVACT